MDAVDRISFLSDRGYDYLDNQEFSIASNYFMNAASLANNILTDNPQDENLVFLIKSLVSLAKNAQSKITQQIIPIANQKHISISNTESINVKDPSQQVIYNTFHGNSVVNQKSDDYKSKKLKLSKKRNKNQVSKKKSAKDIKNILYSYDRVNLLEHDPFGIDSLIIDPNRIGTNLQDDRQLIWDPEELMNGIVTITGGSGSGKTECLKLLARNLTKNDIPCLIFDLHGDIDIGIETISLDYRGNYGINPMELTSKADTDGGPIPHINRLMTQFSYAVKDRFSSTQASWLRNLLRFAYSQFGIIQEDISSWEKSPPDFKYFLRLVKNPNELILEAGDEEYIRALELITKSTKVAVENRLVSILEHPAFYAKHKVPIDDLKTNSYRILLKPLNTIDMQFLASDTIIRQMFAHYKSMGHVNPNNGDSKLRLFIIIDEVKVLTGYKGKMNDPYHILNIIATEARKFGLGLILASQVLGHFGRDIRANAATKLILRTMDQDETKRCSKEMKIKLDEVANITRPGEGFIITSKDRDAKHIQLDSFSIPR